MREDGWTMGRPVDPYDLLPDVRDGLTRPQRIVLHALHQLQQEYGERSVPSAILYGRVSESLSLSPREFEALLAQLVGRGGV